MCLLQVQQENLQHSMQKKYWRNPKAEFLEPFSISSSPNVVVITLTTDITIMIITNMIKIKPRKFIWGINVTLITPYPDITSYGVRSLSSCLKKAGHKVKILFLTDVTLSESEKAKDYMDLYSQNIFEQVLPICKEADLIGFSIMTNYTWKCRKLTEDIKKNINVPVIWGGIHTTALPEDSLECADYACIGEAEEAIVEFADALEQGKATDRIQNFWCKSPEGIIRNPVRPLNADLDSLPIPDYNYEDQYVLEGETLKIAAPELVCIRS